METKNKGGRPRKFQDLAALQAAIDGFFESCYKVDEETGERVQVEPFTITGLALALDTSRETLMDVENSNGPYSEDRRYSDAIKRAKLRCQQYAERRMFQARNPAGAIFALKNYGWRDTQDINHTLDGLEIVVGLPKPE